MEQYNEIPTTAIEHIRQHRNTEISINEDHYAVGYILRGSCRISSAEGTLHYDEHTPYIIDRGEHTIECRTSACGIFEQVIIHFYDTPNNVEESVPTSEIVRFDHAVLSSLTTNLSIEQLAERCCISLSTFKRRFRSRYSAAPHRWITEQRMGLARTTLLSTNLTMQAVMALCGFENSPHFISLFKRHFNITPARLRRLNMRQQRESIEAANDDI